MMFSRDIPIGGFKMTEDIKALSKLGYIESENLKKSKGMGAFLASAEGEGGGIRVARRMAHDNLIDEVRRSLRYYTKESGVRDFDRVLFSGGASMTINLNSQLAQALSMTVEIYNPFELFTVPPGFNDSIGAQLAIACGSALREE